MICWFLNKDQVDNKKKKKNVRVIYIEQLDEYFRFNFAYLPDFRHFEMG